MRYEIIDHGVDNSQYFQGCGTAFTSFDNCVTGIGDSFRAGLEDALESMAQMVKSIPDELESEVADADETITVEEDSEDCYHYVSIRWTDADEYEVICGNIGSVYSGNSRSEVDKVFAEYVFASESTFGRASGEDVTIMQNGEPIKEHIGSLSKQSE